MPPIRNSHTRLVLSAHLSLITRQAIEQRFTPEAAQTLKATLDAAAVEVISADPQTLPLLEGFNGVYLQDSSWITLPNVLHETWEDGRKKNHPNKSAVKLHLRFDVATGTFEHFQLTDGITADSTVEKQIRRLACGRIKRGGLFVCPFNCGFYYIYELSLLTSFWKAVLSSRLPFQ